MSDIGEANVPAARPLDRADERVRHDTGVGAALRDFARRIRSGDLGPLPVIIGLAIILMLVSFLYQKFLSKPVAVGEPSHG